MDGKEIVDKISDGASLRTFMVPDDDIPSNHPEHIESYTLPHILIKDNYFFGKTETAHIAYLPGEPPHPQMSFCYTNIGNIFCSYTPSERAGLFMSKKRYRKHIWTLKKDYRLVWDSAQDRSPEKIKIEIEACAKFKIALLDVEEIWNIHPVDLPMYYTDGKTFLLKTVMDIYPLRFRNFQMLNDCYKTHREFFDTKPIDGVGTKYFESDGFPSFYEINSDGSYRSYYDVTRDTVQRYKRLKVFSDRL